MEQTIGEKIRNLRKIKNMTQKELGDLLKYSESYISLIENGSRSLGINDINKIAQIFGVSYQFLLSENIPHHSNHFRATKVMEGMEFDNEQIIKDFIDYAKK